MVLGFGPECLAGGCFPRWGAQQKDLFKEARSSALEP